MQPVTGPFRCTWTCREWNVMFRMPVRHNPDIPAPSEPPTTVPPPTPIPDPGPDPDNDPLDDPRPNMPDWGSDDEPVDPPTDDPPGPFAPDEKDRETVEDW